MWKVLIIFVFYIAGTNVLEANELADQIIKIYSSSKTIPGFNLKQASFNSVKNESVSVATVNSTIKYQTILGFGGTLTDATGINLAKLTKNLRAQILEALFGDSGIGINLCRVPIGGTEFSTRPYSLDDTVGDMELKKFSLQIEDLEDRIPIIRDAQSLRNGSFKLFASAWSAPLWMRDYKIWNEHSMLGERFHQVYAEYLKKFLDGYAERGISLWGITTGSVPTNAFLRWTTSSMGWLPDVQSRWIKENFGPLIRNSSHKAIKILGHDDVAGTFPHFVSSYIDDGQTLDYIDGLTTHWYAATTSPTVAEFAKNKRKQLFLLAADTNYGVVTQILDNWDKSFNMLAQVHKMMQFNYIGWVDYNLVLNSRGGPSFVNAINDAPIILSEDLTTFTKTPAYYTLGHFSKFVIPGSVRIDLSLVPYINQVFITAFLRPDKIKVVSIYNANLVSVKMQLNDGDKYSQAIEIPARSVNTLLYSM